MPRALRDAYWHTIDWRLDLWGWFPNAVKAYLIPPLLRRVLGSRPEAIFQGTTMLVAERGVIKLFSCTGAEVKTFGYTAERLAHIETAFQALSPFLSLTDLSVDYDKGSVREAIVDGQPFHLAAKHQRDLAFQALLGGFTKLAAESGKQKIGVAAAAKALHGVLRVLGWHPFATILRESQAKIEALLGNAITVPSHGDLHGNNVLVEQGGPMIIDLDHFGWRPFFYDALTLPLVRTARSPVAAPLFNDVLRGQHDRELDNLCRVAGAPVFSASREAYLLATIVFKLHEGIFAEGWSAEMVHHWLAIAIPQRDKFS